MIKKAKVSDAYEIAQLAVEMWDNHNIEDLQADFISAIRSEEAVIFLKYEKELIVGFAQCQLRHDYVEGTDSSPVGYLEGIFIQKEFRKKGYAKELLEACENWSKEAKCTEFASDCELDNKMSLQFHLKNGFNEANRIICFTKKL